MINDVLSVALDYQFGATDDAQNPLAVALSSVLCVLLYSDALHRPTSHSPAVFSAPNKTKIFIGALMELLPAPVFQFFVDYAPVSGFRNGRRVERMAVGIAKELVEEKAEALLAGKGKRDIMSLLGAL